MEPFIERMLTQLGGLVVSVEQLKESGQERDKTNTTRHAENTRRIQDMATEVSLNNEALNGIINRISAVEKVNKKIEKPIDEFLEFQRRRKWLFMIMAGVFTVLLESLHFFNAMVEAFFKMTGLLYK